MVLLLLACTPSTDDSKSVDAAAAASDRDDDGVSTADGDCDDDDPAVGPGAAETCNGLDDDCDGDTDEGVTVTVYADIDGDGYGDPGAPDTACAVETGFAATGDDCDDSDPDSFPGATEVCDEADNDCDQVADDGLLTPWYADADGDTFGAVESVVEACSGPANYVATAGDCNDADRDSYPDAPEVCDEVDNDCDLAVDEEVTTIFYADVDGDGFGSSALPQAACALPTGFSTEASDCDDADPTRSPGLAEVCNGIDDDCDLSVDDGFDADGDGLADCYDTEVCDGLDNDGDGDVDEAESADAATWYFDIDGDGHASSRLTDVACAAPGADWYATADDCDDASAAIHPGATETCNGEDDDCDGSSDEADADGAATWYLDDDGDGFGDADTAEVACDAPADAIADGSDCDDADATAFPGNAEECDEIDNDCDGDVDEGAAAATEWYADADGDGYGDPDAAVTACDQPADYVANAGDCDDAEGDAYTGAKEIADGVDNDCDGDTDECILTVTDAATAKSDTCTITTSAAGVLHARVDNPDGSMDGYFYLYNVSYGVLWLWTGTKSYVYTGSYTAGIESYDTWVDLPAGVTISIDMVYNPYYGSAYTGTDTLTVTFEEGGSVWDGAGSLIVSQSACGPCSASTSGSTTVAATGDGVLVDITSTGGGGGAQAVYFDGAGWIRVASGGGGWEPFAVAIPPDSYSVTVTNEDDYWGDNGGTRGADVYAWGP